MNGTYPQVGGQQAGQRHERRRHPGARRQRPEELLGQGGRSQLTPNHKVIVRRTSGTTRSAATAATAAQDLPTSRRCVQTNPVQTTQAKYTGIRNRLVFESNFSVMDGADQLHLPARTRRPTPIRIVDTTCRTRRQRRRAREEHQPNSRAAVRQRLLVRQDAAGAASTCSRPACSGAGSTTTIGLLGAGRPLARSTTNGVPTQVREFNSPAVSEERRQRCSASSSRTRGSMNRADAEPRRPLGPVRRHAAGAVERPAARSSRAQSMPERSAQPEHRRVAPRRVVRPDRQRPDRAQGQLQPLRPAGRHRPRDQRQPADSRHRDCPWTDPNGDGKFQTSEVDIGAVLGVQRRHDHPLCQRDGSHWPYSDEVTAGIERSCRRRARRRDVLLPHQPRADRQAQHAVPTTRLHARSPSPCRTAPAARSPARSRRRRRSTT